jgi:acyl-CoA synthetase (AMP-forming)/AMP-acid ligase II
MSPLAFLKSPLLWLTTITKYKAEISAAPNFAYTRCVTAYRKLPAEKRPHIDLSCLKLTCNAAEPIRVSTLKDFQEVFGPLGFGEKTMAPAYGLAEHVVYCCGAWTRGAVVDSNGFVVCGEVDHPLQKEAGIEIIIMGNDNVVCKTGETGGIWLHSPSCAAGYWGRPEKTEEDFGNMYNEKRWLATGDLGYIKDGLLFVTGRQKDVIIVNGRNFYPQDVEVTVESCDPEIRPGCTAAFQLSTGLGGEDGREDVVGVAAEVRSPKLEPKQIEAICSAISGKVLADHGLVVGRIALLKMRTIPKTVSFLKNK